MIAVDVREVLDYHVLSKECCKSSTKKVSAKVTKSSKNSTLAKDCDVNFSGSLPAMEAECTTVLWSRSVEHHSIRYKWMASDGDSEAFNTVDNVYSDCRVEMQDCVGHVQKCMGKHVMNLKARTKENLMMANPF